MVEAGIRDLLRNHDCVIVPGLGGFLATYQPAEVNTLTHQFRPPYRKVSFNRQLLLNDGLLVNHISAISSVPYKEAESIVFTYAENAKARLERDEVFEIDGIGEIKRNRDGNLVFEPAKNPDLWDGGFGLGTLFSPAIFRKERREHIIRAKQIRRPERFRRGLPAAVKVTLAAAIPLIIFLLYGIIHPAGVKKLPTNYSGIMQLISFNHSPAPREFTAVFTMETLSRGNPANPSLVEADRSESDLNRLVEEITAVPPGYHIIGGTFATTGEANAYMQNFARKGYEPIITGLNKYGHYRVSIRSFALKSDAIRFLKKFRDEEIEDAWLLKK